MALSARRGATVQQSATGPDTPGEPGRQILCQSRWETPHSRDKTDCSPRSGAGKAKPVRLRNQSRVYCVKGRGLSPEDDRLAAGSHKG